jgi:hypothetical protein
VASNDTASPILAHDRFGLRRVSALFVIAVHCSIFDDWPLAELVRPFWRPVDVTPRTA